jgi:hypothetical protein
VAFLFYVGAYFDRDIALSEYPNIPFWAASGGAKQLCLVTFTFYSAGI